MKRILPIFVIVNFAGSILLSSAERVSTDESGLQANDESDNGGLSEDGRYVVFESEATNLLMGDTNGFQDIYRKDRVNGTLVRASVPSGGGEPNADCESPKISANGRYIFFRSGGNNLVSGDGNGAVDIFRRDIDSDTTIRVSTATGGGEGNGDASYFNTSSDGRFVVFRSFASNLVVSDTNGVADIFLKDIDSDTTVRVSTTSGGGQANFESFGCSVSDDGNLVAFDSVATNLVLGDTNGFNDIFHKNVTSGAIVRANTPAGGGESNGHSQSPEISADGAFVAFESFGSNLIPGDTNGNNDVFVKTIATGSIARISTSSSGGQGNADSGDPDFGNGSRLVSFESSASNLVPGDTNGFTDCFVKDLDTGLLARVSTSSAGVQGNGSLFDPELSDDGAFVVFDGFASNLIEGDTNSSRDVFVKEVDFVDPNAALKASLLKKIRKLAKKAKVAKRNGKQALAKRLEKKIKKLKQRIKTL